MLSKLGVAAAALAAILGAATLAVQPASAANVVVRGDDGGRFMGDSGGRFGGDDWWRFHHRNYGGPRVGFGFGFNTGPDYYAYDEPSYTYVAPSYSYSYARPAYAYNDADAYCAARFRTWSPVTHTYMGYDGLPHS